MDWFTGTNEFRDVFIRNEETKVVILSIARILGEILVYLFEKLDTCRENIL